MRRPEVSAALAAVLDRATAKDLDHRYPDAQALIADLEDVLATESSRTGHVTGEATTVLASLPESARKRVPLRLRSSRKAMLGGLLALAIASAAVLGYLSTRAERGTGTRENIAPAAQGLEPVKLGQRAASDFDPIGGDGEHPRETSALLDGDPSTTWSTESYDGAQLSKDGVGVIIDASPGVAAQRLAIRTPTPGFEASIWVADSGPPKTAPPAGWTRVSSESVAVGAREQIDLDTAGNRYRHYLVWITKLPAGKESVEISEILLYQ
jgi:serine/threonine-protein kinase